MKIEQLERTQFRALELSLVAYQSQVIDNPMGVHLPQVIDRKKYSDDLLVLMREYTKGMQEAQNQETLDKYAEALKQTFTYNPVSVRSYYLFQFELAIRRVLKKGYDFKKAMQILDRELDLIKQTHGFTNEQDYDSKDTAQKLVTLHEQAETQAVVNELQNNIRLLDALSDEGKEMRAVELLARIHQDKDYIDPSEMEALTMQDKLNQQIDAVTAVRKEYVPEVHSLTEMAKEWIPNSIGMALGIPGVIFAVVATSNPVLWALAIGAIIPSVADYATSVYDQLQDEDVEHINKLDMPKETETAADEFISHDFENKPYVEPEEVDLDIDNTNPILGPETKPEKKSEPKPEAKLAPNETEKTFWEKAKPWVYTGLALAGLALAVVGIPGLVTVGALPLAITGLALSVGVGIGLGVSFVMTKMKLSKVDKDIQAKQDEFKNKQIDNMTDKHIVPKQEKLLGVERDHAKEFLADKHIENNLKRRSGVIEETRFDQLQNNVSNFPKAPSPKPGVAKPSNDEEEGEGEKEEEAPQKP